MSGEKQMIPTAVDKIIQALLASVFLVCEMGIMVRTTACVCVCVYTVPGTWHVLDEH